MLALEATRYRAAVGLGLLLATVLIGLGVERLARGAVVLAIPLLVAGVAVAAVSFTLEIEGSTASETTVLLLTREACPHCDEARAILTHLQDEYGFDLWAVDVTGDDTLTRAYGRDVPVVVVEQERVASLEVREAEMRSRLDGLGNSEGTTAGNPSL